MLKSSLNLVRLRNKKLINILLKMDRFKSFKNYLTSSTSTFVNSNGKTTSVVDTTASLEENNEKIIIRTSTIQVDSSSNLNDTINAEDRETIQNLSSLNVEDDESKKNRSMSLNNNNLLLKSENKQKISKFLRSKSINYNADPNKANPNETITKPKENSKQEKKQVLQNSGRQLFDVLEKHLDELIEHFKSSKENLSFESPLVNSNETATLVPLSSNQDSTVNNKAALSVPIFMETSDPSTSTYFQLSKHAQLCLKKCIVLYDQIEKNCHLYDYDLDSVKSNGYRSVLNAFDNCIRRLYLLVTDLNDKKKSFLFQLKLNTVNSHLKEMQTWVRLVEKFEIVLDTTFKMQEMTLNRDPNEKNQHMSETLMFHDGPTLFISSKKISHPSIETNLYHLASIYQDAFFGRACGFQFCESLQIPLTGCAVALASYNDGYEAYSNKENQFNNSTLAMTQNGMSDSSLESGGSSSQLSLPISSTTTSINFIGQATLFKSLFSGTKYILDPELRAKKVSKVMKEANVEFCKAFWQLTETSIVQMGSNLITPVIALNVLKKISLNTSIQLPRVSSNSSNDAMLDLVTINPPQNSNPNETIQIRILSSEMRSGMELLTDIKTIDSPALFNIQNTLNNFNPQAPKSPYLILHIHGGGFIAHSSKSHEIYLKPWCKELKIPIVSIDYSLAPEQIFPRASEECFYVYAWCLNNKDALGWTGDKIVCVGDSAGGVLVTNIVQRAINNQIRIPDALIPIYTPFMLMFSLSPSRLMSVMDPLLNLGVLWRCLAAYCGIDAKVETENYRKLLNLGEPESEKVIKRNKSVKTTPVKAKSASGTPTSEEQFDKNVSFRYSKRPDSCELASKLSTSCENVTLETKENVDSKLNALNSQQYESKKEIVNEKIQNSNQSEETPKLSEEEKQRLLKLHRTLGDAVFLIEKLRDHPLTLNPYMSPLLSDDSVLSKFPKTFLITTLQDPLLDDNIEFNKKLNKLNVPCRLHLLNGLHHGFLNFITASKDCHRASKYVCSIIKIAFDSQILIDQQ